MVATVGDLAALACSKAPQAPQPAVKLAPPKEAQGSAWNANNYHFEEQRLDAWGRERLRELLKQKVCCCSC